MKQVTIYFETVGQCPLWCCDTYECGNEFGPDKCLDNAISPVPADCPCGGVPKERGSEKTPTNTTKATIAQCEVSEILLSSYMSDERLASKAAKEIVEKIAQL